MNSQRPVRGWRQWALLLGGVAAMVVAAMVMRPGIASAAPGAWAPTPELSPLRLLRQASLDLRGTIPTVEELRAVIEADDPQVEADAQISAMIGSDAYYATVREYHRSLLWSSMAESVIPRIGHPSKVLTFFFDTETWLIPIGRFWYRGGLTVRCLDEPQTQWDEFGRPIPISSFEDPSCTGPGANGTCVQEGYVMVEPYWAPGTQVKVCAFDAMETEFGLDGVTSCELHTQQERGCGCGSDLRRCNRLAHLSTDFRDALAEEPLRIFENVIRSEAPYHEAFTTDTTWVNGTLNHYFRHAPGVSNRNLGGGAHDPALGELPGLGYGEDAAWVPLQREGAHAGVLTTYAYLARFASNRARANRFHSAFLCDPFVPPEEGLPPEEAEPNPNLRERAGCAGCHDALEPSAAHWARWRTDGDWGHIRPEAMSLSEPDDACVCGAGTERPVCNLFCSRFHVTADNSHPDTFAAFGGRPLAAAYLDPQEVQRAELGPAALLEDAAVRDQMAACMVSTMAEHLLGRALADDELTWAADQTAALLADGMRFNGMVTRMIADPRYRAVD